MERKVPLQKKEEQVLRGVGDETQKCVSDVNYYFQEVWKHPNRVIRKYFCLDCHFQ